MADYNWPDALPVQTMVWTIEKSGVQFTSPFAGTTEVLTFPGWRWLVSVTIKPRRAKGASAGLAQAFFNGLAGGESGVLLFNWLRPAPMGTMRGTPTVATAAARGAQSVQIATSGTLLAGDVFKIGNTVYECFADCAPVAGVLTVPLTGRVKYPGIAAAAPVAWDRPTMRFILSSMRNASAYRPGIMESTAIDLEEA